MIIGGYFEAKFDEVTGLYDREYSSDEYASRWSRFVSDGIAIEGGGELTTQNQVSIITDTMKTQVAVGVGFIKGRDYQVTVPEEVEHDAADPTHKRIDRVVIELNLTEDIRAFVIKAVRGIPASEPVAPSLIRNDDIWQISLAQIEVPSNVVVLNTGVVLDERTNALVCGLSNIKQGISPPDVDVISEINNKVEINTDNLSILSQDVIDTKLGLDPITPEVSNQTLTITTASTQKKHTVKIITDITGGAINVVKNGAASKPLKLPNGDEVTELLAETMFYDVIEDDVAFYLAPKAGGAKDGDIVAVSLMGNSYEKLLSITGKNVQRFDMDNQGNFYLGDSNGWVKKLDSNLQEVWAIDIGSDVLACTYDPVTGDVFAWENSGNTIHRIDGDTGLDVVPADSYGLHTTGTYEHIEIIDGVIFLSNTKSFALINITNLTTIYSGATYYRPVYNPKYNKINAFDVNTMRLYEFDLQGNAILIRTLNVSTSNYNFATVAFKMDETYIKSLWFDDDSLSYDRNNRVTNVRITDGVLQAESSSSYNFPIDYRSQHRLDYDSINDKLYMRCCGLYDNGWEIKRPLYVFDMINICKAVFVPDGYYEFFELRFGKILNTREDNPGNGDVYQITSTTVKGGL